jgi:hypothetical protein
MSSENLKKLYEDIYSSPNKDSQENKQDEESISQKFFQNDSEQKNKPIPKDLPQTTIPFRTSNAHQIYSEEKSLYNIYFEQINEKLKVHIHEKDSNPKNIYEKYFTLDELIEINDWFKIFYNIKDLLSELDLLIKNDNLGIKLKKFGELSLNIILPNKLMDPIEIIITQNEIKERKLFKELYLTLLNIEQKHRQESKRISEKLINLEHAVGLSINQSQHNRYSIKAKENLEQMKNALKQEIQMMESDKVKFGLNNYIKQEE